MRVLYRARQFVQALFASPDEAHLKEAKLLLPPPLRQHFDHLPRPDQCHSLNVYTSLKEQGETNIALLQAALLHDVGKSRYHLNLIERVIIVLAEAFLQTQTEHWGAGEPRGLRRAFVIAAQHPAWGADLIASAGGSKTLVRLIRHHQDTEMPPGDAEFADLLLRLQHADGMN